MKKLSQQRFEAGEFGRAVISGFVLVMVVTMVALNMPRARITQEIARVATPIAVSTGVDGNWGVFAPDPRRESVGLTARVKYADGSVRRWDLPHGGPLVGEYWDYRWLKWMEIVIQPTFQGLWQPAARYIARRMPKPHTRPVQVTLTRHDKGLGPPGPKRLRKNERWLHFDYYILDLRTGKQTIPKSNVPFAPLPKPKTEQQSG